MSYDYFNLCTDDQIRNVPGYYKNIDDVLLSADNMGMLEERMEKMLEVCLRKNMKLHEMDKLGVKLGRSSSYNPQSKGGTERVCKSIREVLEKKGGKRTDQLELSEFSKSTALCNQGADDLQQRDSTRVAQKHSYQAQ